MATLRGVVPLTLLLCALGILAARETSTTPAAKAASEKPIAAATATSPAGQPYTTETLRGRVVWLEEALSPRFRRGDRAGSAAETTVVLETADGQIVPIIPDVRGRAFAVDERLRDIDLQLLVRRYQRAPLIQVIRVLRPKADGLYEIDYWCDICAIPMFILKPCECCQGPTRLREQLGRRRRREAASRPAHCDRVRPAR